MSPVRLHAITKTYGRTAAVDALSLDVRQGELVALLGPSGCGKTTTLRMIGGFMPVTSGTIAIGDRDVTGLPPSRRDIGFGFQSYALFPHLTVARNVAFGLEMRRQPRSEVERRTALILERVRLGGLADRLPKQLSGGQQQRVSLARALVIEPELLLLDEPLSNLDAQLRQEMKVEIRQLQRSLGITTLFVTHDQDEAMSIADRVVVMRQGRIEQDGSPEAIFSRPRSRFVAEFMGVTNLLTGEREGVDGFRLDGGERVRIPERTSEAGHGAVLAIRPERVCIRSRSEDADPDDLAGRIELATYRGQSIDYRVETASGLRLSARSPTPAAGGPAMHAAGDAVRVVIEPEACLLVAA